MAVIRIEKNKNYTVMSNYHLQDKRLSLKAVGLLSVMLSLPAEWDFSVRGLAKIRKECVPTIMNILQELESTGYLSREQKKINGRYSSIEYTIREIPCSKNLNTEKLNSENLNSKNFTQENTKEEITKEESTKESKESSLSQQEYDLLVNEYGKTLVDEKIENASNYKNCMKYEKIREWCEVDKNKKKTPKKSTNKFNNFKQREYSKEEMEELEKAFFN